MSDPTWGVSATYFGKLSAGRDLPQEATFDKATKFSLQTSGVSRLNFNLPRVRLQSFDQ